MIRIVMAENQPMLSDALESLLNLEEDMEVIGKASNRMEALSLMDKLKPDVLILDSEMIINDDSLHKANCKIIVLATLPKSGDKQRVLQAGVAGFLKKDSPIDILTNAVRSIMGGKQILDPELMEIFQDEECIQSENDTLHLGNRLNVKAYVTLILGKIKQPTG
jgi:two-component system, NarL family, response regulator DesR